VTRKKRGKDQKCVFRALSGHSPRKRGRRKKRLTAKKKNSHRTEETEKRVGVGKRVCDEKRGGGRAKTTMLTQTKVEGGEKRFINDKGKKKK